MALCQHPYIPERLEQPMAENNQDTGAVQQLVGGNDFVSRVKSAAKKKSLPETEALMFEAIDRGAQAKGELQRQKDIREAKIAAGEAPLLEEEVRTGEALIRLNKEERERRRPVFEPTRENFKEFAGIFSILSALTFAVGGKGRGAGMSALSALNGALEGYNLGRKDVFERNLREYKAKLDEYKTFVDEQYKDLRLALDLGGKKTEAGRAKLKDVVLRDNGGMVAAQIESEKYPEALKTLGTIYNGLKQRELKELEIYAQQQRRINDKYMDVQGRMSYLNTKMPQSEWQKLGPKEVPMAAARLESADLTKELSDLVKENPKSAGIASTWFSTIDRFMPSRYKDVNTPAESQLAYLNSQIDAAPSIKGATPDEISMARVIAKKAVDVVNARAFAASGGSRLLVSELNMQKGVIGIESLSPKSAVAVYDELARSDRESLRQYGIDIKQLYPIGGAKLEKTPEPTTTQTPKIPSISGADQTFGGKEKERLDFLRRKAAQ